MFLSQSCHHNLQNHHHIAISITMHELGAAQAAACMLCFPGLSMAPRPSATHKRYRLDLNTNPKSNLSSRQGVKAKTRAERLCGKRGGRGLGDPVLTGSKLLDAGVIKEEPLPFCRLRVADVVPRPAQDSVKPKLTHPGPTQPELHKRLNWKPNVLILHTRLLNAHHTPIATTTTTTRFCRWWR